MRCPNCKTAGGITKELESSLPATQCNKCGGVWIKAANYWRWLQHHGRLPELPTSAAASVPVCDSTQMKICPDCGHFMTRRKVGHGISFQVDRCGTCGGIWLDKNEWEVLKSRNLHDEIHFIFSEPWQKEILQQEHKAQHEAHAKKILGDGDYAKVTELKSWLASHPHRDFITAYLMNE